MSLQYLIRIFINWQPSLKGQIQEIRKYDWFNLLASGSCTERYQYRIRSNHNGSKVTCNHVETSRKYVLTSVIALFTLFYLVWNVALRHNQVWQCISIATLNFAYTSWGWSRNLFWASIAPPPPPPPPKKKIICTVVIYLFFFFFFLLFVFF